MRLQVEELEQRDCPSIYPIAPAGMEVLSTQDIVNLALVLPGSHVFRETPLMPVLQWSSADPHTLMGQPSLGPWQQSSDPGAMYAFLDKTVWLALQDQLYGRGVDAGPVWNQWIATQQAAVQQADAVLFAAQDTAQSPPPAVSVVPPTSVPDPLSTMDNVALIVTVLQKHDGQ